MTTCPSGVHYMHLVDHARAHIEETYRRPLLDRLLRRFLAGCCPSARLRARDARGVARPAVGAAARRLGLKPLAAAARLAPPARRARMTETGRSSGGGPAQGRVALLSGCANEALAPSITQATIRLLNRHGVEVVVAPGEGCCGSLDPSHGPRGRRSPRPAPISMPGPARSKARGSTPSSSPSRAAARR